MRAYIHIPFCRQKCLYCKFALTPFVRSVEIARYIRALEREIDGFFEEVQELDTLQSIYFWWGTPSVLAIEDVSRILLALRRHISSDSGIEITFEANPEDLTQSYARDLLELGVNRLSLWVQTLSPKALARVGRSLPETIFRALEQAFSAGFRNVNVDFILGLPDVAFGQTLEGIRTLHDQFSLTHTSVYLLENGVYPADWMRDSIDEDSMRKEYFAIEEYLVSERGFRRYEVSNFAAPGYESSHNLGYWKRENCRGFWLSAATLWNDVRFENAASFGGYYKGVRCEEEVLDVEAIRLETILCGLRTSGAEREIFGETGRGKIQEFIQAGWLSEEGSRVFPTSAWIFILDRIIGELV